jgi:DNA invertase Pin-like site-specific DNA recombinase
MASKVAVAAADAAPLTDATFKTSPIASRAFNSLDAQREACAAFILSQKHEGWTVLPALYDDGGFSGGTMERPALKKLIADIEAGQIDVIVVYKVDRLLRWPFRAGLGMRQLGFP